MAYILYHTISYQNKITGDVLIKMYKKDGTPGTEVTELRCTYASRQYLNGEGTKFDTIIASELVFGIRLPINSPFTYDDFLVSFHDEWKVELYNEGNIEFIGWLTPNEGSARFRDLPYDIELIATDGLGFLKTDQLSKVDTSQFSSEHTLIEYLAGALAKTRLQLNIRIYCNLYHISIPDRNTDLDSDMFSGMKLEYRTFQNDDSETMDCYSAIERLLKEGFSIYQWFGRWCIFRCGELQESVGPNIYYTEYNPNGVAESADQDGYGTGQVAKQQVIHPRDADQDISAAFAIKYARHNYNYVPWPELPKNNKFERGEVFEEGDAIDEEDFDGDGNTVEVIGRYKKYTIEDWEQGIVDLFDLPHPAMTPTSKRFYRLSTFNEFGVEIDRRIIGESYENSIGSGSGDAFWLRTIQGIPVKKGGVIEFNIQKRFDNDFSNSGTVFTIPAVVYLVGSNGITYQLNNNVDGSQSPIARWKQAVNLGGQLILDYGPNQDTRSWNTLNVRALALPVDGTVYVAIPANGPTSNTGPRQHFKDIKITYSPYVAGGYIPVKGDYWYSGQNQDYKDNVTEEVYISDSPEKIFKGALLQLDGTTTQGGWYRLNVNEQRQYKELINMARYNAAYRRMERIKGTFGGTTFRPMSDRLVVEPLSFHRHFALVDDPVLVGKYFVLVPPLTVDYGGQIKAVFLEAFDPSLNDGKETGNTHEFKYIFK